MTFSVFHFFKDLCEKRDLFSSLEKLDDFPFDKKMLSCQRSGQFPDLSIRIGKTR